MRSAAEEQRQIITALPHFSHGDYVAFGHVDKYGDDDEVKGPVEKASQGILGPGTVNNRSPR